LKNRILIAGPPEVDDGANDILNSAAPEELKMDGQRFESAGSREKSKDEGQAEAKRKHKVLISCLLI
jgi:hypothetical protein